MAGRRELSKDRYTILVIRSKAQVILGYEKFIEDLRARRSVACMFICPPTEEESLITRNAQEEVLRLATLFVDLAELSAEELIQGKPLSKQIELLCPVTNTQVVYPDFDGIAFCPQSGNLEDDLYDPLMVTPIGAVNIASDIYAFSMFTRDYSLQWHKQEVWKLPKVTRQNMFKKVIDNWQTIAEKTINNYIAKTDTSKFPVYLTDDNKHWYASHQDPAFAESCKELYRHDMPIVYTPKIIKAWEDYFESGMIPSYGDAASPGFLS